MSKESKPKRGPGRPPSDSKKVHVRNFGICDGPQDMDNRVEFVCKYPLIYKRLYALYKNTDVTEIVMCFNENSLNMFGISVDLEVKNYTFINCNNIYRYYCEEEINFTMTKSASEKVINRLDTKHFDIMKIVVKDTSELIGSIDIILCNSDMECVSIHTLGVSSKVDIDVNDHLHGDLWDESLYSVSFTLPHKLFKKYITDIQNIVTSKGTMSITSVHGDPLKFEYFDDSRSIVASEQFNDAKIKLCRDEDAAIVAVSVVISNLKKLSGSEIADNVTLYIDLFRPVMCVFSMDDAMVTKSIVPIVDLRQ